MSALATAHGRALAMSDVGELSLLDAEVEADGSSNANADPGGIRFADLVCIAGILGTANADPGLCLLVDVDACAAVSATGCGFPGNVSLTDVMVCPKASGIASGITGSIHLNFELIKLIRAHQHFGSSMAGASLITMQRVNPTHLVIEYDSQGPTNSDVVSSAAVIWLDALISNVGSSTLYIMFFDSTTVPSNGTLPMRQPVQLPAGGQTYIDVGNPGADGLSGRPTQNGLSWAASTTGTTLTVDSTSSIWATARTITIGT